MYNLYDQKVKDVLNDADFNTKTGVIAGEPCVLITRKSPSIKWTDDNKRFRSSIWSCITGKCVSSGFNAFVNFHETPDFEPWNPEWKFTAKRKMDGSLWCISKYKGELIIRTRGVFDVSVHDTGDELPFLKEKYPNIFDNSLLNSEKYTILCEHTTPARVIVIKEHTEPTLTLIGVVANDTGEYILQEELYIFSEYWKIPCPIEYNFTSVSECIDDVKLWKGVEGVVLYSPDGQILKKIKASEYLRLHSLKNSISSLSKIIEVFVESGSTTYKEFHDYISTMLDFETAEYIKNDILKVVNSYEKYRFEYDIVKKFIPSLIGKIRKEQALEIIGRWKDWRKSLAFTLLDNKTDEMKIAEILEGYITK